MGNNGQVIQRIQNQIRILQETNNRLQAANQEAVEHLQQCDEVAKTLTTENQAGRRIIWAMAQALGGEIAIPDDIMRKAADDTNQIASHRDPENMTTVIKATVTKLPADGNKVDK